MYIVILCFCFRREATCQVYSDDDVATVAGDRNDGRMTLTAREAECQSIAVRVRPMCCREVVVECA